MLLKSGRYVSVRFTPSSHRLLNHPSNYRGDRASITPSILNGRHAGARKYMERRQERAKERRGEEERRRRKRRKGIEGKKEGKKEKKVN